MTYRAPRLEAVISEIDAANARDPRKEEAANGTSSPREVIYSERLSACLSRLYWEY